MKDLLLPVSVIAVLVSLLVPVPEWMLDMLLVSNLLLAIVLLMSSLLITDPLKLSSLPSMLLLATMYRLALNISTTRMILSEGEAGSMVNAFGSIVVRGNVIVGLIIFLVITLIQFIVIAKGSERVAEVSARFTLDAMPGKQMSIDADVRAGLIDFNEAREKREELQTESRFYGALDGAMKFIKGDAVAGLVITAINIIGGFAIGVAVSGLTFAQAANQYTLLSVGDGLLSQIPALLNSLAAGMIVTRVVKQKGVALSCELLNQLGQEQKVLALAGGISFCCAFLPGMPAMPFISLALILIIGVVLEAASGNAKQQTEQAPVKKFQPKTPALLQLEVNQKYIANLVEYGFDAQMQVFQQSVFEKYGLIVMTPDCGINNDIQGYRILFRGVTAVDGIGQDSGEMMSADIMAKLLTIVAERKEEMVDDIMTRRLLDNSERYFSELVSAVVPGVVTVTQVTTVLRELIKEQISVKNFDVILQSLAEYGPKAGNERILLEEVRIALSRLICQQHFLNGKLEAYVLDPFLDMECVKMERNNEIVSAESITELADELKDHKAGSVLLTSRASRRIVKECLEARGVFIPVLAHEEVTKIHAVENLGYVGRAYEKSEDAAMVM